MLISRPHYATQETLESNTLKKRLISSFNLSDKGNDDSVIHYFVQK